MKKACFFILIAITLLFSKVQAQEITVFPGFWSIHYYQDDQRISKKEVLSLLKNDKEAYSYWKESNTYSTLSWSALGLELGFATWTLINQANDNSTIGPAIATLGSFGAGIVFALISNKRKKQAILKYNKNFDNKTTFKIAPSKSGFGIALSF